MALLWEANTQNPPLSYEAFLLEAILYHLDPHKGDHDLTSYRFVWREAWHLLGAELSAAPAETVVLPGRHRVGTETSSVKRRA